MIDLNRLPVESSIWKENKSYVDSTVAQIEVLSRHKIPHHAVSCKRDGKYKCPICQNYSVELIIDYRCHAALCNCRVIKYKIFDTEETVSHPYYDSYIERFYEDVERRKNGLETNAGAVRN
jgi:hypothetical protein